MKIFSALFILIHPGKYTLLCIAVVEMIHGIVLTLMMICKLIQNKV
jgi:hypothetical protein